MPVSKLELSNACSELGTPIPEIPHAVSVSMPKWQDNVDYEEGRARVHASLRAGYPRFVVPAPVKKMFAKVKEIARLAPDTECMVFVTRAIAGCCRSFVVDQASRQASTADADSVSVLAQPCGEDFATLFAVVYPTSLAPLAKAFWQHTGTGPSSRAAERMLSILEKQFPSATQGLGSTEPPGSESANVDFVEEREATEFLDERYGRTAPTSEPSPSKRGGNPAARRHSNPDEDDEADEFLDHHYGRTMPSHLARNAKVALRKRIANLVGASENDVFLFPSGMAAIWFAHRIVSSSRPDRAKLPAAQYGFPYIDTFKVLEKFSAGDARLFGFQDDQNAAVAELSRFARESGGLLGVFTEFPGNPHLRSPDLDLVNSVCRRSVEEGGGDCPLVVDDTIGNFANLDLLEHTDVICSSLTKLFSGESNVMGGSLILNSKSRFYPILRASLELIYEDGLYYGPDAIQLERNSRDFVARSKKVDENAITVVNLLRNHPKVKRVYHPSVTDAAIYSRFSRAPGRTNGLLSVIVQGGPERAAEFFDALDAHKGPSLGTNWTLACPYTLLAHYGELEFAARFGIEEELVRISVGMEEAAELEEKLLRALGSVSA